MFPPYAPEGPIAPHECEECSKIRAQLDGCSWLEIPAGYVEEHEGVLPLLSEQALHAFLPAWLRQAMLHPAGNVPGMIMVHLAARGPSTHFSHAQVHAVASAAQAIAEGSAYGMDEVDRESLAAVLAVWNAGAI